MIRRKHSLGFMEFMRGRYNIEDYKGVISLFEQMSSDEIHSIRNNTFDDLWNNLWMHTANSLIYKEEYEKSMEKFNKLKKKTKKDPYLGLSFYTENIEPKWNEPEWGFPKGRRNYYEKNFDCANREFREESGFDVEDYTVLNKLDSLN